MDPTVRVVLRPVGSEESGYTHAVIRRLVKGRTAQSVVPVGVAVLRAGSVREDTAVMDVCDTTTVQQ